MDEATSATSRPTRPSAAVLFMAEIVMNRAADIQRAASEAQRRAVLMQQDAEWARATAAQAVQDCRRRRQRAAHTFTVRSGTAG